MFALGGISVLIRSDGMAKLASYAVLIGQVVNISLILIGRFDGD